MSVLDKMLRIAGLNPAGNAKAINVDVNGNLQAAIVKSLANNNRMMVPVSDLVQLTIPTYDGSGEAIHPSVKYIREGWNGYKYWMAFTPFPAGNPLLENPSVVASNDGITWVVPAGATNPIVAAPAEGYHADTELIFDGTNIIVYYAHFGITPSKAYRITSSNGTTWSAPAEVSLPTITDGGLIRTSTGYLAVVSNPESQFTMQRFKSTNGTTFTSDRPALHNLSGDIWHGSMFADGAGLHYLVNSNAFDQGSVGQNLYYGFSVDNGKRLVFDPTPVVMPKPGTWYSGTIYRSCLVPYDADTHILYVSAKSAAGAWGMGYMLVKLNILAGLACLSNNIQPKMERILIDALELRNTDLAYVGGGYGSPLVEFNEYFDKTLYVHNSLDQAVDLIILIDTQGPNGVANLFKADLVTQQKITIPANKQYNPGFITKADLSALGELFSNPIYIAIKAGTVPTTGAISLRMSASL